MPIEKERLIDLLNAAAHIQATYTDIIESVLGALHRYQRGELSADAVFYTIEQLCIGHEHSIMSDVVTITKEQTHWRLTHRKAERNKLYQERRRRYDGRPAIKPPSLQHNYENQSKYQFIKDMEEFGIGPEKAMEIYEDRMAPPSADAPPGVLPPFEPSIEDTDGWALPTSEEEPSSC